MMPLQARVFIGHSDTRDQSITRLLNAIVLQAVRDARSHNILESLDAVLWFAGPDAPLYIDAIGLGDLDPLALLTSGRVRRSRKVRTDE